jgi:hypothetical protein
MAHRLRLWVGDPRVLERYQAVVVTARLYYLSRGADFAVLPMDDDLQDALHAVYGTGDWLEASGLALTSGDVAFAAAASRAGRLVYLETDYQGGTGTQAAVLWVGGEFALKPLSMAVVAGGSRPRSTWPINAALRGLGITAAQGFDEFDRFGLGAYRSNDEIAARAMPMPT